MPIGENKMENLQIARKEEGQLTVISQPSEVCTSSTVTLTSPVVFCKTSSRASRRNAKQWCKIIAMYENYMRASDTAAHILSGMAVLKEQIREAQRGLI